MFTGLVEALGELVENRSIAGGVRVRVASPLARELTPGESVAVNGVCLTVVIADGTEIHADVGPETLRVTTLGGLSPGSLLNLERPLRADGRFGGHIVQGHVDTIGRVEALRPEAEFHWLTVGFPRRLAPYIVHKGPIAIDGISLTVAALGEDRLDVQVVPYTVDHTNIKSLQVGDRVNLECDVLAKYVLRAAELAAVSPAAGPHR
jgi:riboflavin synthase